MAVVGSQKIRPVRVVVGVGVRHGLAGDYFAAEVEIRGHAAQVAGRVVVVVELQPVVGGRFRVFLLRQLCTGKHRLLGKQKAMPAIKTLNSLATSKRLMLFSFESMSHNKMKYYDNYRQAEIRQQQNTSNVRINAYSNGDHYIN